MIYDWIAFAKFAIMIRLNKVTHFYDTKPVIHDLTLNIKAQQLTCLLGGSGSGKTTILRLIAGLETPLSGQITLNGKILTDHAQILIPPRHRGIGFIFQDLALWPHFTVYQNIAFGLQERKDKNIKETVFQMLDFFALKDQANKYPHQLSGGQKQLVAIARALVLQPQILLMDEPLTNLDVKLKRKMLHHIKKMKQDFDLTIIYVTHDHKEAFAISDQIIVLNQGKIEEKGSPAQIKTSDNEFVKYFLEY